MLNSLQEIQLEGADVMYLYLSRNKNQFFYWINFTKQGEFSFSRKIVNSDIGRYLNSIFNSDGVGVATITKYALDNLILYKRTTKLNKI